MLDAVDFSHEEISFTQMACFEQAQILSTLASDVARDDCRFLEVGSWCGDSTIVLAEIAKMNNGHLYCIDWWKGNEATHLKTVAAKVDIFSVFWDRVTKMNLQDVVIPIRCKSDAALPILARNTFDLVYIDADHRYANARNDIVLAKPLVKVGGILCGDDCEGRPGDFDPDFLSAALQRDSNEGVHCGVVKAVSEEIRDYDLNWSIWSSRKERSFLKGENAKNSWKRTSLKVADLEHRRQANPPLIESYNQHNLIRFGAFVYAVPWVLGPFDFQGEQGDLVSSLPSAKTVEELKVKIAAR